MPTKKQKTAEKGPQDHKPTVKKTAQKAIKGGKKAGNVTNNAQEAEIKPRITYSAELVSAILDRVAKGEPLSKVCSTDDMPTRKSFFEWVAKFSLKGLSLAKAN